MGDFWSKALPAWKLVECDNSSVAIGLLGVELYSAEGARKEAVETIQGNSTIP